MLLFVLLEITHVEVLFIAALYFAEIFLPSLFIFEMNLYVLFEISRSCEGFTTFLADKGLLLSMNTLVAIEV